ncbi:Occlusion-derived virus envelope/capsid protein-27 [Trabala vishnou gigantina nucleopolyhedrovirus]|uniref:Occlusion-derived virus envelope/capsid protein-27 n=1 Tax=Trabala vishnou gigantina nucleopolyhedrovirus TaxID=2863583 RepID=UPI002481C160|nr:Occlusion-derived virus envelope/capsid protein-27 [Trabala vishnou gigantina nucleopolyhedrovirus]QYC92707.1 Occlusion-derived virus envelope/capsid protein-27 [Trabala vishnou gigantina nucleopolyhedrovirus]
MKNCKPPPIKIRTVTEIVNSKEKLKRDYDLADFDAKNLNSLESYNTLKIKLILVKYMAMLNTLKLTQPLLTTFRDRNAQREIVTIVLASMGFVHNRVNPLVNNFDNRMEFVIIENRDHTIPGEPIIFRQTDNGDLMCLIDRVSIMKMLERQFDTDMCVDNIIKEKNKIKIMKAFTSVGTKKRSHNNYDDYDDDDDINGQNKFAADIRLSESETTRYLTLLFVIEHAYCHYCIIKNYGIYNYIQSMIDHKLFASKCRPTMNMSFDNLLLSKLKFCIEDSDNNATNKLLNYNGKSCGGGGILSYN